MPATEPLLPPYRARISGTRHAAASGHYLAAQASFQVLEAGGNAVDAGVAGGIALTVVESLMVGFAGVAPILIYLADRDEVVTISGVGTWPESLTCQHFHDHHDGLMEGALQTVVPASPDAWITALESFGTMSFGAVAEAGIRFARDGFPMYRLMGELIEGQEDAFRAMPAAADIYLPGGHVPRPGDRFVQADLGRTIQYLVDEETAHAKRGRVAGLQAARDAFYKGDIAHRIVRHQKEIGGLLTADDMAGFRVRIEPPCRTRFAGDIDVFTGGPWCQGPMMLEVLNILDGIDLASLGHNGTRYIHAVVEAIKLAAADREAYFGDPCSSTSRCRPFSPQRMPPTDASKSETTGRGPRCRLRLASPEPDGRRLWTPGPVTARGRSRRRRTCPPTPPISVWSTATATRSPPPPATATAAAPWCPEPVSRPRGGARADGPTPRILPAWRRESARA